MVNAVIPRENCICDSLFHLIKLTTTHNIQKLVIPEKHYRFIHLTNSDAVTLFFPHKPFNEYCCCCVRFCHCCYSLEMITIVIRIISSTIVINDFVMAKFCSSRNSHEKECSKKKAFHHYYCQLFLKHCVLVKHFENDFIFYFCKQIYFREGSGVGSVSS